MRNTVSAVSNTKAIPYDIELFRRRWVLRYSSLGHVLVLHLGEIKLRENKAIKKEYDIISYNDKKLGESKINL